MTKRVKNTIKLSMAHRGILPIRRVFPGGGRIPQGSASARITMHIR